jgi:cytochrome c oxidase subunit 3
MFFFAFFWAFFHSSLSPAVEIGCVWPPAGIVPFNPWKVPLFNTFILLLSGLTITICHHALVKGQDRLCTIFFGATIFLALSFTLVQLYEYRISPFGISDGIYGSTFFMATGFHGLHVIIGSIFISICFLRMLSGHFTREHHVGFECAAWYWHFVDIVWLFLFVVVYWWGGWNY